MLAKSLKNITFSKAVFYLLIFLIPFQTRKIFFADLSFYGNFHAFYNTIYIYLTDLVIYGLILLWIVNSFHNSQSINSLLTFIYTRFTQDLLYKLLAVFWLILAISIFFSRENIVLAVFWLVKMTSFLLLFAYIREKVNISREISRVFWLILASAWIQAGIAIYQYVFQRSVGLALLGEEFLRPGLPGIAEFFSRETLNPLFYHFFPYLSVLGHENVINIRAYGTFPHPNVLAGFLAIALIVNLYLFSREISMKFHENYYLSREILPKWLKLAILLVSLVFIDTALVLTFSRFAWMVASLSILVWLGLITFHVKDYKVLRLVAVVLAFSTLFNWFWFGQAIKDRIYGVEAAVVQKVEFQESESVSQRLLFNQIAMQMVRTNPILGVGVKSFVSKMQDFLPSPRALELGERERLLPFQHQPVHNIYLLIAAEAGVFALIVFLLFLYNIVRPAFVRLRLTTAGRHQENTKKDQLISWALLTMLFGILVIGMIDHYPWTIQQGQLMFWVVLGIIAAKSHGGDDGNRTRDLSNANAAL